MARPYFASYYRWLVLQHHAGLPSRAVRLLDVGCDDGTIVPQIPARLRVGVDMHPRRLPSPDVAIIRTLAEHLPLLDGPFDSILAFDVLEHIEHDRAVMHEMVRVLAPHGRIWFSTPARNTRMVPWFLTPYTNRSFGHVRNGYTPDQIRALLPDPQAWDVDYFWWNEPFLRFGFVVLHALDGTLPRLADLATRLCYQFDRHLASGEHGHLFGTIRRATG